VTLRRVALFGIAASVAAGVIVAARIAREEMRTPPPRTYVATLPDPSSRLSRYVARGDGQFYATLAIDPTLRNPETFSTRSEAAYRAQRPLLSYLAWAVALGRRRAVEPALIVLCVLSAGFAVAACSLLAARRSAPPTLGIAVLLAPGSLAILGGLGSELLALGFAAGAVVAWIDEKRLLCAGLLVLAALSRESLLLVPAALGAWELMSGRRSIRELWVLALPFAVWGSWLVWIRLRVGTWPGSSGRIGLPFVGLFRSAPDWNAANWLVFAMSVALVVAVAVTRRRDLLGALALAHLTLMLIAGDDVWHAWENFGRPLLPMFAFGILALAGPSDARSAPRAG
jgi:hypothetical protein